jgi:tetratricopeptide (TPR) repeat protein
LPLTNKPPEVGHTELLYVDGKFPMADLRETRVMPLNPGFGCAIWHLMVDSEPRKTSVRQEVWIPVIKSAAGDAVSWQKQSTDLVIPLDVGEVEGKFCFRKHDPAGHYRMRVYSGDSLLFNRDFFVRPLREFPENLNRSTTAPANVSAAFAARQIAQQIKKSGFRRNPRLVADKAGIAIDGVDVTSLSRPEGAQAGKPGIFALWNGGVWLFATVENRDAFLRAPEMFAPEYGGGNAMVLAGQKATHSDQTYPAIRNGKLYVLDSKKDHDAWLADDGKLVEAADAAWNDLGGPLESDLTSLGREILTLGPVPLQDAVEQERAALPRRTLTVERARKLGVASALADALGNRSWSYLLLKRPDDALHDTDEALRLAPDERWISVNRADALLLQGKVDEALSIYTAVEAKPGPDEDKLLCLNILEDVAQLAKLKYLHHNSVSKVQTTVSCPAAKAQ